MTERQSKGGNPGDWKTSPGGSSPLLEKLKAIKSLLEEQVAKDQAKVAQLKHLRGKHGEP